MGQGHLRLVAMGRYGCFVLDCGTEMCCARSAGRDCSMSSSVSMVTDVSAAPFLARDPLTTSHQDRVIGCAVKTCRSPLIVAIIVTIDVLAVGRRDHSGAKCWTPLIPCEVAQRSRVR